MASERAKRELVVLERPPKPISQMTEAELHAFAERLVDMIFDRVEKAPRRRS